jgi:hypothetical protein
VAVCALPPIARNALTVQSAKGPSVQIVSGAIMTMPELLDTLPDEGAVLVLIAAVARRTDSIGVGRGLARAELACGARKRSARRTMVWARN